MRTKKRMKTNYLNVRIDDELKRQLESCAETDGRTLSNLITFILKKYVENIKKRGRVGAS